MIQSRQLVGWLVAGKETLDFNKGIENLLLSWLYWRIPKFFATFDSPDFFCFCFCLPAYFLGFHFFSLSSFLEENREPELEEIWSPSRTFCSVTESDGIDSLKSIFLLTFFFPLLPPECGIVALLRRDNNLGILYLSARRRKASTHFSLHFYLWGCEPSGSVVHRSGNLSTI